MKRATWIVLSLVLLSSTGAEGRSGGVIQSAMRDLAHADSAKRVKAARELGRRYPLGARAVPLLQACVQEDEVAEVRVAAAKAIEALATRGAATIAAFLADTQYEENVAFRQSVALMRESGVLVTPADLDRLGGRAARAIRLCLFPRDDIPPSGMTLIRESLASDAGTFAAESGSTDRATEIACAALAVFGIDGLPKRPSLPGPPGLVALLSHEMPDIAWGAYQLVRVAGVDSPAIRKALAQLGVSMPGGAGADAAQVAKLIKALPDSSASKFNEFSLSDKLRNLASLGPAAAEALPHLRRLYKDFSVNKPGKKKYGRDMGLDVDIAGAICCIDKPAEPYLGALVGALQGEHKVSAAEALAESNLEQVDAATRLTIAKAAANALPRPGGMDKRVAMLALLSALGEAAKPAAGAVAKALAATDAPWKKMVAAAPEAAKLVGKPGYANALFVSNSFQYPSLLAVRRSAMRILSRTANPELVEVMKRHADKGDPISAWEIATARRR